MKYRLSLPMLAISMLLVACNQKKSDMQPVDTAGKVTEVAKDMTANSAKAEVADPSKEQESCEEGHNKAKPGDEFIKTAKQYQEKANSAREAGDNEKAVIYSKLAEIKMEAAAAANEGKSYDWTRYHELVGQLEK